MSRVVLITTEPLPLEGWPTTGAGLRAWGLAQGLRSRGHEVKLLMPDDALAAFSSPKDVKPPTKVFPDWIGTFHRKKLAEDERVRNCDVIVLQHWGIARDLGEVHVPLAMDLAGPHLLERQLWGSLCSEGDVSEKLDALRRADFVTASGERQRLYFLPYLAMAGWDIASPGEVLPVIPFSLRADAMPAPVCADRFNYGGFLLPWQDPSDCLEIVMEELSTAGHGELVFIGGAHPHADVSRGRFEPLLERLKNHPRVRMFEPMSYDDYTAQLRQGGIALDLMARNAERELAFTTRTVQYMACGLPVIHDDYSELGEWIRNAGAGWTFNSRDKDGLRTLVRNLLNGTTDPTPQARAARNLVAEKLDWEKTIGPLVQFCAEPRAREEKLSARLASEDRAGLLTKTQNELSRVRAQLNTLLGKRWVRWGLRFFSARGWLAWPAAFFATVLGVLLIPVFWLNDLFSKD